MYDYILFAGALLILVASLGILRMPDIFLRMHASAKAGTLGAGLVLSSTVIFFASWSVAFEMLMAIVFLVLTAPVAFHLLGRAGYRQRLKLDAKTLYFIKKKTGSK